MSNLSSKNLDNIDLEQYKKTAIFAIDLGTSKFCLARLTFDEKSLDPRIKKITIPSGGMKRGMVYDMHKAKKSLERLILKAEDEFCDDIKSIYLGVAGSHLKGKICHATLDLGGDTITEDDQKTVIDRCMYPQDPHYEVLHNIPIGFTIDSRQPVDNAVGFSGDFLKCDSFVISSDKNYLKDLIRLCNMCGLTVKKLYAEPYASAMVTASDRHKRQGVVLADIGGGTTDGIVFKNGKPIMLFNVNVAGELMSRDLATCLQISLEDAYFLKHEFGLSYYSQVKNPKPEDNIKYKIKCDQNHSNSQTVQVSSYEVFEVLSCRVTELYGLIMEQIGEMGEHLTAGVIITGGGSELKNLCTYLSDQQPIYISKNNPSLKRLSKNIKKTQNNLKNQKKDTDTTYTASNPYATVCGLLYLGWCYEQTTYKPTISKKASVHLKSLINWLKEIA